MDERNTQFDYLLNAFELASQSDKPAENGYAAKRKALYAYVRDLERQAQKSGAGSFHLTSRAGQAPMEGDTGLSRSQQERVRHDLRDAAFAKAGAELYLERVSDEMALIRLNIGHMSFGIGQPRNGTEAVSVLRTFREALTDLLAAAVAWQPNREAHDCNPGGAQAERSAAASEPTDDELLASFVKSSGGPNPFYRCIHCSQTEPGLRKYLAEHWKICAKWNVAAPESSVSSIPADRGVV